MAEDCEMELQRIVEQNWPNLSEAFKRAYPKLIRSDVVTKPQPDVLGTEFDEKEQLVISLLIRYLLEKQNDISRGFKGTLSRLIWPSLVLAREIMENMD